jgi:hypothetical protein
VCVCSKIKWFMKEATQKKHLLKTYWQVPKNTQCHIHLWHLSTY